MPSKKKEWYVAIGRVDGDYAGNPLSFDASDIYGPYTERQARAAETIGERFPDETFAVCRFRLDGRPDVNELLDKLRQMVKEAEENDESEAYAESEG